MKEGHKRKICVFERELTWLIDNFAEYIFPPNSDWSFFSQIFELIIAESQGVLICGGDLNIRLCPKLDSSKIQVAHPSHLTKRFISAIKDTGLLDVWRELNPLKREYTYFF